MSQFLWVTRIFSMNTHNNEYFWQHWLERNPDESLNELPGSDDDED